ncbi:MAG: hypothetical protein BMS9Abin02_1958 [Anaerolineae bacterium]|nr:MAG: hypothetical protein BMS9Abin02_1958 [Anaerolineae bacterium]
MKKNLKLKSAGLKSVVASAQITASVRALTGISESMTQAKRLVESISKRSGLREYMAKAAELQFHRHESMRPTLEISKAIAQVTAAHSDAFRTVELASFSKLVKTFAYQDELMRSISAFTLPTVKALDLPIFDLPAIKLSAESFNSLKHISSALDTSNLDNKIQAILAALNPPSSIDNILEGLRGDMRFLGDFDFSYPESTEEGASESDEVELILPEDAEERIARVDYLPYKIMDAIAVNPDLMHDLSPREFEKLIADLIGNLGFNDIILTPRSGDGGRDVLATQHIHGIPVMFVFECKRYAKNNKVGPGLLRTLLGTVSHEGTKANIGVLVTTSTFTRGGRDFILSESNVDGKDFGDIVKWIEEAGRNQKISKI